MSLKSKLEELVLKNSGYVISFLIVYSLLTIIIIAKPQGFSIPELEGANNIFGTAMAAFILLISIGSYQIYRYLTITPPLQKASYQLVWGISFLIYSITYIGLMLEAYGFDFADMNKPEIFLIWRSPMIIWVSGMLIGTIMLFTNDELQIYLPAAIILILGELWFVLGLIVLADVEFTMYGFLFWEFIPMAIVLACLWYNYGKNAELSSPYLLSVGFIIVALAYVLWAPFHYQDVKYIWAHNFNLFIIGLTFIFAGFYALPKEMLSKEPPYEEDE